MPAKEAKSAVFTSSASPCESAFERLEKLWQELITFNPTSDDIIDIVRVVPYLSERAWTMYCARNPSEENLRRINLACDFKHVRALVYRRLMDCFPNTRNLLEIARDCEGLRPEASRKILASKPGADIIKKVIDINKKDESVREEAAELLMSDNPTHDVLRLVTTTGTKQAVRAADLLLEGSLSDEEIRSIIIHVPAVADKIWRKFGPTLGKESLISLLFLEPPLSFRLEAAKRLLDIANSDLRCLVRIFAIAPELRERVLEKLHGIELSEQLAEKFIRDAPELETKIRPLIKVSRRDAEAVKYDILLINVGLPSSGCS